MSDLLGVDCTTVNIGGKLSLTLARARKPRTLQKTSAVKMLVLDLTWLNAAVRGLPCPIFVLVRKKEKPGENVNTKMVPKLPKLW